jgi:hypothetical protein
MLLTQVPGAAEAVVESCAYAVDIGSKKATSMIKVISFFIGILSL